MLDQAANLLHALGFRRLRATGLKRKHVNALVAEWQRRGLAVRTMKNRMSALRWWAERVGRPSVVATNAAHGIGERRYVTNEDRSRGLDAEKLARVSDAHVRMSLKLQAAFGFRQGPVDRPLPGAPLHRLPAPHAGRGAPRPRGPAVNAPSSVLRTGEEPAGRPR